MRWNSRRPDLDFPNRGTAFYSLQLPETIHHQRPEVDLIELSLSPADRTRCIQRQSSLDQWHLVASRLMVALAISNWGLSHPVRLKHTLKGQPFIDGTPDAPHISVSHHGPYVLVGLSAKSTIGVDIVSTLDFLDWRQAAGGYLNIEEIELIERHNPNEQAKIAALFWASKEAILKKLGYGLLLDPKLISLQLAPQLGVKSSNLDELGTRQLHFDELHFIEHWLAVCVQDHTVGDSQFQHKMRHHALLFDELIEKARPLSCHAVS